MPAHGTDGVVVYRELTLRLLALLVSLLMAPLYAAAQPLDTLGAERSGRCVRRTVMGLGAGMAGTYVLLDRAWYADYERSPMHAFNDGDEWMQMDKAGHVFSAYTLGSWGHAMLSRCGTDQRLAVWAGGSLGLVFLSGVELLDGTSAAWGFSWWDMAANVGGAGLFMGQQAWWKEQRLQMKLSAHLTTYAEQRPDLLGERIPERLLKDYNGQTIWLSGNIRSFAPKSGIPKWLNLAVGMGAESMTTASPEPGDGRYRQIYVSPDIDLTRISTRSPLVRTLLFVLNGIKIPAPAVEFRSTGQVVGHWVYF